MVDEQTEQELIRRAQAGDTEAFGTLIEPHLADLKRTTARLLRTRPDADPDDIVQDTMIRVWEVLGEYDTHYRFSSFLFGIHRFIVLRAQRRPVREQPTIMDGDEASVATPGTDMEVQAILRGLVGVDRFDAPDRTDVDRAIILEALTAMFWHGGYPHQQTAFTYAILLWGKTTARTRRASGERRKADVRGNAAKVVDERSTVALSAAADELWHELTADGWNDLYDRAFAPFRYRLGLTGNELFAKDKGSARSFAKLLATSISETSLRDYFGDDPRKSVADWCNAVKKRTLAALQGNPTSTHLPWPEGHENYAAAR